MVVSFAKYHGAGNDFILLDDRKNIFLPSSVSRLCDRRRGIGADGLILLQLSLQADYRMRIYNCDGGEVEMCGNGIRCLVHFIGRLGESRRRLQIETMRDILLCERNERISIFLSEPEIVHWAVSLADQSVYVVDTGVPHAIIFVENVDTVDFATFAAPIRHHPLFAPRGVNVSIASVMQEGVLKIRTFERGVEGETLACGTAAAAGGYVASRVFGFSNPLSIYPASKEPLFVQIENNHIQLSGPTALVFEGRIAVSNDLIDAEV